MIELPLVFVAGALGSSHCLGMCGGFAVAIAAQGGGAARGLARQLVYSAGRVATYGTGGALAGYGGLRLAGTLSSYFNVQAVLALVAGAVLIYQGLRGAGWLGRATVGAGQGGCLASGTLASLLRAPGMAQVFVAGMFTGLIPCGLVYGFLSLAASTQSPVWGLAVMVAFGLGTVPMMVLAGWGASAISRGARQKIFRLAALSLVLSGTIALGRGGWWLAHASENAPACPACREGEPLAHIRLLERAQTWGARSDK